MAELSVNHRLNAIEQLAVRDDDGAWDAGEIQMLAEAAKQRFADAFAPEGVAFMTDLYKNPDTKFVGDAKKSLLDVLVNRARVDRSALAAPGEPVELRYQAGNSDKFYQIAAEGRTLTITYGRTGTAGQQQVKQFPTATAALKEYDKKLKEKLREGYQRTDALAEAAPAAPVKAANSYSITEIPWSDLEKQIERLYGVEYEIVANEEWSNDSQHRFEVEKGELDEYDRENVDEWLKKGYGSYMLGAIMNDMCNKGHLEPGNYLVTVCW